MPRLTDRSIIYDLTGEWLDVVVRGGTLFLPHANVWTPSTIESLYEQIVTTPDDEATKFHATLLQQAKAEGPAGHRLAAEALYVWQLKDSSSLAMTKRKQIQTLLDDLTSQVSFPSQIEDGFEFGMANYGPGRLRSLADYVFVLRLALQWAALESTRRDRLLADPWEFRSFIRSISVKSAVFAREAIQHLVHPDTFEPIASLNAKRTILRELGGLKPGKNTDLDQELVSLRQAMESDGRAKPGFRFYGPDIRPLWDKSADDAQLSLDSGSDSDVSDEEQAEVEAPITVSSNLRIAGRLKLVDLQAEVEARELLIDPPVLAGLVAALNSGKHVVLTGAPGTAKTTLAEAVSAVAHRAGLCTGHTLATATADWSTYETVGGYRPLKDSTLEFEPGVVLESIASDSWLVLDEMNRANTDRALGPLFTVLSGQAVVIPAERDGRRIRIRPSKVVADARYADHVVSPAWRIIATTNVLDRALLFDLSFALMRRFAFIEVTPPDHDGYRELVHRALAAVDTDTDTVVRVEELVARLLALVDQRALGPALFMDAAKYMAAYIQDDPAVSDSDLVLGAFFAFFLPQFEGVDERQAASLRRVVVKAAGAASTRKVTDTLRQTLGVLLPQAPQASDAVEDFVPAAEDPTDE
ncbi:AAA family ATPase [Pseudonocardia alni]|uniref:AAA family ATPase n=1 Tax=Pseudonocardia alni TaxID=33907 RepID=UPI00279D5F9D|nr:AAA domain-containing protein [Pseudonocardia alni]